MSDSRSTPAVPSLDRVRAVRLLSDLARYEEGFAERNADECDVTEERENAALLRQLAASLPGLLAAGEDARTGVAMIAAERKRQLEKEGWSEMHDDDHVLGEMAITAACYAANGTAAEVTVNGGDAFPWGSCHDKRRKHGRIRQLVIAGALIAAEIDRLQRSAARSRPEEVSRG